MQVIKKEATEKMHPRNPHRKGYNFKELIMAYPELEPFVSINKYAVQTIDFSNAEAVKALNKSLLKKYYGIDHWDIPHNYLCPPVPGRADYIHQLADLLASVNDGITPTGKKISGIDIGTGANCIYPIIGIKEYGWSFVGSDIDPESVRIAAHIAKSNKGLSKNIECRIQNSPDNIFQGVIQPGELFDFSMCNPPFHGSPDEAASGTARKWKNLGVESDKRSTLNFGGQNAELWCEGGERKFVNRIIDESILFSKRCFWFSTLLSKKENLAGVQKKLKESNVSDYRIMDMAQGQKISRIVAWTFLSIQEQRQWSLARWKKE